MKRLIDRMIGLVAVIIAIYAGMAVAAELLRPYVATIVTVSSIVVGVITLIFVAPALFGMGSKMGERFRNGPWSER